MPDLRQPDPQREVNLEDIDFLFSGEQSPDDAEALKLVKETFSKYETQRYSVERRWETAQKLYHGVIEQRNWPGTDVPRAALPVYIVHDQVEAAYPRICEALFNYWPTFFDVTPGIGSTAADAVQIRDVLAAYLETPFDESGVTPLAHMKMAVKQAEKLGDGAVEISWDADQKRFIVEWVDARDLYLDPQATGPAADWSPAVMHRKLMTVQDLKDLRGTPGVNIPSDEILNYFAKARYISSGDMVRQREASSRKEAFYIGDLKADPRHQLVEVLVYWTKDRLIWVLGRMWTAINKPNPYGFIPYGRAPYNLIEGRPYSEAIPDVLEGDQKYAQGIRNARLDNLSLGIIPPRTRALGTPTNASKRAWAPGMIDEVADPKQVEVHSVENMTQDAMGEEQIIHQGAAKRFGINDFVQSGIPTPSNANRTAGGVAAQQTSVGTRLSTPVSYFEDFLIIPLLYKATRMIAKFAPEQFQVTNPQTGQTIQGSKALFGKSFNFRMHAANRMRTKDSLAMFLGPVSQLLFNEAVMHQANLQGLTLDFREWQRFFQDATGTSKAYDFFRSMSPQEQQMLNQPDPKTAAEMQMKQMDIQARMSAVQAKAQTEHEKNTLDFQAKTHATAEKSATEILKMEGQNRADHWNYLNGLISARQKGSSESND